MNIFILEDEIYLVNDRFNNPPRRMIIPALKGHSLTVSTNIYDAQRDYRVGGYDLLLLDCDMNGRWEPPEVEHSGYQFVKWLVNKEINPTKPQVILHSQNREGRAAMSSLLTLSGFMHREYPYGPNYIDFLTRIKP